MPELELVRPKAMAYKKVEEYINMIRTNIQFSGANYKRLVITSTQPGEGKSSTSTNIAISFARLGKKTLLVDADIRNSVMSGTFQAKTAIKGLSSYLSGNAILSEVICTTNVPNLDVIPSGKMPPNPTSLLQNGALAELLETANSLYDYVIIDTPPIGLVVDAAIIANYADASLLVVEDGSIRRSYVEQSVAQMSKSTAPFLGIVMNKVDTQQTEYGNYGDYGNYGARKGK